MARRLKIHPSIGVARVGNSPDDYFIGPEQPGDVEPPEGGYRDGQRRVKRQGARFRVFVYDDDKPPRELTAAEAQVEWSVHLANKKSAADRFHGVRRPNEGLRNPQFPRDQLVLEAMAGLVDARGRSARGLGAAPREVHDELVAILAVVPDDGQARDDDDLTLVESCPDGWFYSARLPSRELVVAYMTDADYVAGGRRALDRQFHGALAAAAHTSRRVGAREPREPLRAAPSHTSIARDDDGSAPVSVGDAAFSLDPLSAHGLRGALASALAAAEAIDAHLHGRADALARYRADARTMFDRQLRARHRYYAQESRWPHSPFWRRRQQPSPSLPAPGPATPAQAT